MTKKERIQHQEKIKEMLFDMRAKGKRYEEIAVEAGVSIDTIRRMLYAKNYIIGQLTIRKLNNFFQRLGANGV